MMIEFKTYEEDWIEYQPDRGDCKLPIVLKPKITQYQCLRCNAVWTGYAGPTDCTCCGNHYVQDLIAANK